VEDETIAEEKKSRFGKMFGLFKGKNQTPTQEISASKNEIQEISQTFLQQQKPEDITPEIQEQPKEEMKEESKQETEIETQENVEEVKLDNSEKTKKLVERYGVTKEIPKRKIEEAVKNGKKETTQSYDEEIKLPDIILRLEKVDGKIDIMDRSRNDFAERTTQLAEEIGELRSMIMERERALDKITAEFEMVKDAVSDIRPQKIKKELDKREVETMEDRAKIEKIEVMIKTLSEENKNFREKMEKIKSFENLVELSYELDRKISEMKEIKTYADMMASKVESIFSELNEKVSQLESQREKIDKMDELTIEMTKMLDEVSLKLTKFVEEKDLKNLKKTLEEGFKKMAVAKTASGKTVVLPDVDAKFSELSSKIDKLRSIVESQNSVIMSIIDRLQGKAEASW
jgi:DNA repair exonuclease SbcCD ATPase subunit